jgi:hypothetical protein
VGVWQTTAEMCGVGVLQTTAEMCSVGVLQTTAEMVSCGCIADNVPNEHCTSANTLEKREPQPSTLQAHANVSKSAVGKQDGERQGGHQ